VLVGGGEDEVGAAGEAPPEHGLLRPQGGAAREGDRSLQTGPRDIRNKNPPRAPVDPA